MTGKRITIPSLVLLVSSLPCLAQSPYAPALENEIPWPTGSFGTAGSFHKVLFGHYAGSANPGALALVGDQAVYLDDPVNHDYLVQVKSSGVEDIAAVAPEFEGDPVGMALIVSGDLWLYSLDSVTGNLTSSLLASGPFGDLDLVRSGDIDGLGTADLVAVEGAQVYPFAHTGSAWTAMAPFAASGTVHDLVVLDWDSVGSGDIALLLDQSVEVRRADGTLIESFAGAGPGGLLAALPATDLIPSANLAWSIPIPPPTGQGNHALTVLGFGNDRRNCGVFSAIPETLTSAIQIDSVGSTRVDLLTSLPTSIAARIYEPQLPSIPYSAGTPQWLVSAGTTAANDDGYPAFGDATNDGVADLCFGRGATDEFIFLQGEPNVEGAGPKKPTGWKLPEIVQDQPEDQAWFKVGVELPADLGNFNHVQIYLRTSGDGTNLDTTVRRNHVYDNLTAGSYIDAWMNLGEFTDEAGSPVDYVCDAAEGFVISARLVKANLTGAGYRITEAGPKIHGCFSPNATTHNNLTGGSNVGLITIANPCEADGEGDGPRIGYVPLPGLPPPSSPAAPVFGAVTDGPTGPQN